jgi:hypothetical protein
MPRKVDPKSKSKRIVFAPENAEDEKMSENFKELCLQDGLQAHDLLKEAIELVFKKHNYPPGNPQLLLARFMNGKPVQQLGPCGFKGCNLPATGKGIYLPTQKEYLMCKYHKHAAQGNPKNWKLL